jgi:hypothetical protein
MLIRGDCESLVLVDGRRIDLPPRWGLVWDETGRLIDRCTIVITQYEVRATGVRKSVHAMGKVFEDYFGQGAELIEGSVDLPDGPWQRESDVARILYKRYGKRTGSWLTRFKRRGRWGHSFDPPAPLYRQANGDAFRLVLPRECVIDERGFVWP